MHMADALVAPAVATTMYLCSAAAGGYSVRQVRALDEPKKVPVMGVMGAFVFATQMINFTIPGTGSSGHLCGGMLLSALLGPYAGFLTMIGVLLIQCLLFADGGLLALGCNIWNMAKDYIEKLKKRFEKLKLRKCKGVPYKRINGQNIFVDDFDKKVIKPLLFAVHKIQHAENTYELWHSVQEFNKRRIKMHWGTPQNAAWLDAYKGAGAFFTMQNMIRFHNCVIIDDNGKTLSKNASLAFLNKKAKLYENREGWRLIGMLKKTLDDNNIDVVAKMKEWRK